MAWPNTPLAVKVELALGADPLDDPANWSWTDVSAYARNASTITIRRGKSARAAHVDTSTCALELNNSDGRFTPDLPTGAYYPNIQLNTPIRVSVDPGTGFNTRFVGFVGSWKPSWPTGKTNYSKCSVTASGLLQRLNQDSPLRSAFYRSLTSSAITPLAYWPCEDASGSSTIAAGITGGIPATYTGTVNLGSDSSVDGSGPLLKLTTGATVEFTVAARSSGTPWAVRFLCRLPNNITTDKTALVTIRTPLRPIDTWDLTIRTGSPDKLQLFGYDNGVDQISDPGVNFTISGTEPYGDQLWVEINAVQSGADINWSYTVRSKNGSVSNSGTKSSANLSGIRSIGLNGPSGVVADLNGATYGHMAVSHSASYGLIGSLGAGGWAGEPADDRFTRLCGEQGIQASVESAGSDVVFPMGPQGIKKFVDLLREVEDTDQGAIRESRIAPAVVYRNRFQRFNRTADLSLTFGSTGTTGNVLIPFEPIADDQDVANSWTVTRDGGISATYTSTDLRLGTYPGSSTVNLDTDVGLVHHAEWQVHLGMAAPALRTPALIWDLHRTPSLVASWLACDLGSRISVANPPPQYPPDPLDLLLDGYTETIASKTWRVQANTSPYRPYEVSTVQDSRLGRLDTDGSEITTAVTSTGTSLTVVPTSTAGPKWITTATRAGDFPFDAFLAGERITVTAISNAAAPTFVNAGTAAHGDNASLTPGLPASIAAGDLLLVFAAIRATGAGVPNLPAGYRLLADLGNVALFGKYATASESAPTVTFTGGVSGNTTSAQMAAFRNVAAAAAYSSGPLGGLAQNISYPELGVITDNCVILWLGWKASNWTSVATVSGATAEIGEPSSALGSTQGIVWDYLIQTTAASIPSGSFTVTGGLSATTLGAVVALRSDPQTFTVTRSVNGVSKAQAGGTAINIWRPGVVAL